MDGREAISSYFLHHHRAIGSQPGLHAPSGFRQIDHSPSLPVHSIWGSATIGPGFQIESSSAIVAANSHSINAGSRLAGLGSSGEPVKRKRGRPRKYGPDGTVSLPLALSSTSSTPPGLSAGMGAATGSGSGYGSGLQMQKRGRGRPPGTGRKQLLASLGEWISGSAGMGFTPHVILIPIGEDIAAKIMSFSQQGPRAVCILSANGAVSTVTLRQPASSGGTITYEDRFEILSMTGSFLLTDDGGSRSWSGGLSICLSDPNGRVIGGGVAGLLIAASPVQVIVGSFMYGGTAKSKNKPKTGEETGAKSEPLANEREGMLSITLPNQGFGSSTLMGGWPRNPNVGIDLTQ